MPLLFYGLILQANSKKKINHKNNGIHICFIFAGAPGAGTYPPLPAHIHWTRENGEWCICIQILKNGPATWPYTSSKTGRPSAPPPRSSAYPNPPYMQTQQKGTVPLVDSVTERQQSSELPPSRLLSHAKVKYRWWKKAIIVPYGLHPPLDKRQMGSRLLLLQTSQNGSVFPGLQGSPPVARWILSRESDLCLRWTHTEYLLTFLTSSAQSIDCSGLNLLLFCKVVSGMLCWAVVNGQNIFGFCSYVREIPLGVFALLKIVKLPTIRSIAWLIPAPANKI